MAVVRDGTQGDHLIVAALIWRGDNVLLVRQQGPDDPVAFWALPGGVVEGDELLHDALAREVTEETGLVIEAPERLVYVAQLHNSSEHASSAGELPAPGGRATTFVFEVHIPYGTIEADGTIEAADPDGFVLDARFVPRAEAVALLGQNPFRVMREPIAAYLEDETLAGSVWLYRREHDDDELIARIDAVPASEGRNVELK